MTAGAWHEHVQVQVVEAARRLGWRATMEVREEGWVADVVVEGPERPLIIEAQRQVSIPREAERHQRYIEAGYEAWWLSPHLPRGWVPRADLPLLAVRTVAGGDVEVAPAGHDRGRWVPLVDWLRAVGEGRVAFASVIRPAARQHLPLALFRVACWRCGAFYALWLFPQWKEVLLSPCGEGVDTVISFFDPSRPEVQPPVVTAARKLFADVDYPLARVERRFSRTAGEKYRAFTCPHCGALFGAWYIHELMAQVAYEKPLAVGQVDVRLARLWRVPVPHWCLPLPGERHCGEPPGVPVDDPWQVGS